MNGVVLFGGGGHARAVADVLVRAGSAVIAVVDPRSIDWSGVKALGADDEGVAFALREAVPGVVAVGDNQRRFALLRRLQTAGVLLPFVKARSATVATSAEVREGVVVLEHAHVGPGASVGSGAVVNTTAVLEHDTRVGVCALVGPGAVLAGGATCGDRTLVGAGAILAPGIRVGSDVVVAAGAAVVKDVTDGAVVVGVPARPMEG